MSMLTLSSTSKINFRFGGGPRGCIGSQFARLEAQLVLSTVIQKYEMDLVADRGLLARIQFCQPRGS